MSRRKRAIALIPFLIIGTALLAGCTITASGTGTVVVTSDSAANTYDPSTNVGTIARLCAATSATCKQTDDYLYSYYPTTGSQEWTVAPGFPVVDRSGQTVGLPAGQYTLQATEYSIGMASTNAVQIDVFSDVVIDLTTWLQSYGRASVDAPCRSGWQPGWAQWPNDGSGGFVCNRTIYAYYPDLPVPTAGTDAAGTPWQQSVARSSAEAECPDGYDPGWAQWPNDGSGGFVCNRTSQ